MTIGTGAREVWLVGGVGRVLPALVNQAIAWSSATCATVNELDSAVDLPAALLSLACTVTRSPGLKGLVGTKLATGRYSLARRRTAAARRVEVLAASRAAAVSNPVSDIGAQIQRKEGQTHHRQKRNHHAPPEKNLIRGRQYRGAQCRKTSRG